MALRPLVHPGLAGCCTVLSLFGVLILAIIGLGFASNWEAFMGSTGDPADGAAVATTCYVAALVFAGFAFFCGCQLGHARYSRIALD
ncbi:hypothetical protein FA09DRAFT_329067 [Tilletiopsis washingtonensis]|uniref:MARVEL domain-containing protein n=1 Tax=Tilletiopsis washingtonensis TaxID=58919 RepID=A0A316ZFJ8_9BASI|nr:hypothetical protein FA09DRAFT_329067 [Tilletiopsis washingtonensis]PWN99125.1 hypothetical protein FA09DRAFT_329067 [Tilletiopsis washingtonensis]